MGGLAQFESLITEPISFNANTRHIRFLLLCRPMTNGIVLQSHCTVNYTCKGFSHLIISRLRYTAVRYQVNKAFIKVNFQVFQKLNSFAK